MISTDKLAQAFSIGAAPATDEYRFATVTQTEGGTYVKLSNTKTQTRCTDLVGVSVGDRVQVCIKANGSCVIIGVIGESEIDRKLAAMEPVELYNNASGKAGLVELNDSAANYKMIEIYSNKVENNSGFICNKVYEPDGKRAQMIDIHWVNSQGLTQILYRNVTISGRFITTNIGESRYWNSPNSGGSAADESSLKIFQVIGYR